MSNCNYIIITKIIMNLLSIVCLFTFIAKIEGRRQYYHREDFEESSTKIPTIVDGVKAEIELFPYLAVITKKNSYHCGGVVISDRVILTAAHCIFSGSKLLKPDLYKVLLGSTLTYQGAVYDACAFKPHPEYNKHKFNYFYDLSLILVNKYIKFNKRVRKAFLVPHNDWRTPRTTIVVAGYGRISTEGDASGNLLMTTLSYISNAECNSSKTSVGVMPAPNHMFCMVADRLTGDCYGDSGSGVMWGGYVVGIVSTGRSNECGTTATPSMYTDVYYFKDWINNSIRDLESGVHGCEINRTERF